MVIAESTIEQAVRENEIAREQGKGFPRKRFGFGDIFSPGKAFVGITGLRGIGKSTLLKQRLFESKESFYVSLDRHAPNLDLFALADVLNKRYGVKELLLDEINYCADWQHGLKSIYDLLGIRVFFTSSVAIEVAKAKADLSRRAVLKNMHPFSFREFLFFSRNENFGRMTISDLDDTEKIKMVSRFDFLFGEYVSGSLVPAFLEEKNPAIFTNILDRIIERDLVVSLYFDGKDVMNAKTMLDYISKAGIDDVSYSSISRNIGITKYKAMEYVDALEKAFVLNLVKPFGSNVLKEPKIMLAPPFRAALLKGKSTEEMIGLLREEFFVGAMRMNGFGLHYLKGRRGEKKPDYLAVINGEKYVFEIGGPNKSLGQLKASKAKKTYVLSQPANVTATHKPLIFAGFM